MKNFRNQVFLLMAFFITPFLYAQNRTDQNLVKNIYEQLQTSNTESLEWLKSETKLKEGPTGGRYHITIKAILQNEWQQIAFEDIEMQQVDKNKVRVTGVITGRQPTECEFVTSSFKHLWTLKDGQIIKFYE